jgi:HTH-type transcriptional regulator/antitoxin HigA
MIRALNSHLKIPASVLIQRKDEEDQTEVVDWDRFPIKAIIDFGWIKAPEKFSNLESEDILKPLFSFPGTLKPQSLLLRSSNHIRSARSMDEYALRAWSARVVTLASKNSVIVPYQPDILTFEFLRGLTKLSSSETGPLEVIEKLKNHGINVIVERHLPRTYIDGAAIIVDPSNPIIGLTLRYDRIDNFWFTLIHELAHLALHLNSENNIYFDDMDIDAEEDQREREANEFASEILIPKELWNKSPASRLRSSVAAEHLAKQLGISPAIVAGRMQHEFKAFKLFTNLVGRGKVRRFFPEVRWE